MSNEFAQDIFNFYFDTFEELIDFFDIERTSAFCTAIETQFEQEIREIGYSYSGLSPLWKHRVQNRFLVDHYKKLNQILYGLIGSTEERDGQIKVNFYKKEEARAEKYLLAQREYEKTRAEQGRKEAEKLRIKRIKQLENRKKAERKAAIIKLLKPSSKLKEQLESKIEKETALQKKLRIEKERAEERKEIRERRKKELEEKKRLEDERLIKEHNEREQKEKEKYEKNYKKYLHSEERERIFFYTALNQPERHWFEFGCIRKRKRPNLSWYDSRREPGTIYEAYLGIWKSDYF